jgi:hypothetical protein
MTVDVDVEVVALPFPPSFFLGTDYAKGMVWAWRGGRAGDPPPFPSPSNLLRGPFFLLTTTVGRLTLQHLVKWRGINVNVCFFGFGENYSFTNRVKGRDLAKQVKEGKR